MERSDNSAFRGGVAAVTLAALLLLEAGCHVAPVRNTFLLRGPVTLGRDANFRSKSWDRRDGKTYDVYVFHVDTADGLRRFRVNTESVRLIESPERTATYIHDESRWSPIVELRIPRSELETLLASSYTDSLTVETPNAR